MAEHVALQQQSAHGLCGCVRFELPAPIYGSFMAVRLGAIANTNDAGAAMQQAKLVELLPIEDTFVTKLGKLEFPEPGWMRSYLYAKEGGVLVLKARLVIPLARAVEMNGEEAAALAVEFKKLNPLRLVT